MASAHGSRANAENGQMAGTGISRTTRPKRSFLPFLAMVSSRKHQPREQTRLHQCSSRSNLTVKLSGRPEELRAHHTQVARWASQAPSLTTVHGPLQRLLEDASNQPTVRAPFLGRKPEAPDAVTRQASAPTRAHKGCVKRRVFGFSSQLFMTFKASLGCGL